MLVECLQSFADDQLQVRNCLKYIDQLTNQAVSERTMILADNNMNYPTKDMGDLWIIVTSK